MAGKPLPLQPLAEAIDFLPGVLLKRDFVRVIPRLVLPGIPLTRDRSGALSFREIKFCL